MLRASQRLLKRAPRAWVKDMGVPGLSSHAGPFDCSTIMHPMTPNEAKASSFRGFTLTFLGTSSGIPTQTRHCSATALRSDRSYVLVDCGEGTQLQMHRTQGLLNPILLDTVLITHMHGDHVLGLPGLLMGLCQYRRQRRSTYHAGEAKREQGDEKITIAGPQVRACEATTAGRGRGVKDEETNVIKILRASLALSGAVHVPHRCVEIDRLENVRPEMRNCRISRGGGGDQGRGSLSRLQEDDLDPPGRNLERPRPHAVARSPT